jgi:hypothetical protein
LAIFGGKMEFLSKNHVVINFLHNLVLVFSKNAKMFAKIFSENILKIITSVPGHPARLVTIGALSFILCSTFERNLGLNAMIEILAFFPFFANIYARNAANFSQF